MLMASVITTTGGKGSLTQWVHCNYIVKTMWPAISQWGHVEFFYKVPINLITMCPVGPCWAHCKSAQWCGHKVFNHTLSGFFESLLWNSTKLRIHCEYIKKNPWALFERTLNEWLRCIVGLIAKKIVKETRKFFHKVPSGHFDGHFVKELHMCPLADGWPHCLKNHNVITMYPLGKWPLAPSVIWNLPSIWLTMRLMLWWHPWWLPGQRVQSWRELLVLLFFQTIR